MILRIFGDGKKLFPMGCAEGLAPCLIGEFSALLAMRLGKFPNKLRYFLSANTRVPSVPACFVYLAYQLCIHDNVSRVSVVRQHCFRHKLPLLFFLSSSVAGAVVSVCGGSFAWGCRMQGSWEEYYPKHEGGDCSHDGFAA